MRKLLAALALVLLATQASSGVWWSEGLKVNPTQDMVLAQTAVFTEAAFVRVEYLCTCQNAAASTTVCAVEIQRWATAAVVNDPVSTQPQSFLDTIAKIGDVNTTHEIIEYGVFYLEINDRIRIIFKGSAALTGSVKCTLWTN
jgi:hypothetical protein